MHSCRRPICVLMCLVLGMGLLMPQNVCGEQRMKKEVWFGGGCFWGVQEYFSRIPGVLETMTGYANSMMDNPGYREVCTGNTGAVEAVKIVYDPEKTDLEYLVECLFGIIDPFSVNRQGNDVGPQYRTGVYYDNPEDGKSLERIFARLQGLTGLPLAVELAPLKNFFPAEDYHQDYLKKNPGGYCHIDLSRKPPLRESATWDKWVKPDDETLKEKLSPIQYAVTQNSATEPPFTGEHWNRHDEGIYVDIVSGEPLFSSRDKFDSGTGWASFIAPIEKGHILGFRDESHGMKRLEARSGAADSHLGHIFPDGPVGRRYCINDAALRFVPKNEMEKEGYGAYLSGFMEK